MLLVGLTGGIATGKSTVASMFRQCGAVVIDADQLAQDAVKPGKSAWRAIVKTFGRGILNPDRTINRRALGAIVFADRAELRRLERIIHPRVVREQVRLTKEAFRKAPNAIVIYDVPLLFEAGIDKRVDKIVVVTVNQNTQIARLKKRNRLTRVEAVRRIHNQLALAEKVRHADFVLRGTLTPAALRRAVKSVMRTLRSSR
ncbi:MAG: dephospho-CoA kinase [Nitrospiraceae bacterium]